MEFRIKKGILHSHKKFLNNRLYYLKWEAREKIISIDRLIVEEKIESNHDGWKKEKIRKIENIRYGGRDHHIGNRKSNKEIEEEVGSRKKRSGKRDLIILM